MTVRGFRTWVFLWVLAALLACLAVPAQAASGGPEVWISPDGELTADAITLNKNEGKGYTLYLPGNLKTEELRFGLADGVSFTFGSRSVKNGDGAGIIKPGKYGVRGYCLSCLLYTRTFTVITTLSNDPARVSAAWIGTALWAARSASDWLS